MPTSSDEVREVFDTLAGGSWEALYKSPPNRISYNFITRQAVVEELLTPIMKPDLRVVDIGCGTGDLLPFHIHHDAYYTGVDFSRRMIERARARYETEVAEGRASFIEGDCESLPVADGAADVVSAVAVLEYLPDPRRSIDEIARILRPGGSAIITVPHKDAVNFKVRATLEPLRKLVFPLYLRLRGGSELQVVTRDVTHTHYRPEEFDVLMEQHRFEKTDSRFTNFAVIVYPLDHFIPKMYMRISDAITKRGWQSQFRRFALNYIGLYELR